MNYPSGGTGEITAGIPLLTYRVEGTRVNVRIKEQGPKGPAKEGGDICFLFRVGLIQTYTQNNFKEE